MNQFKTRLPHKTHNYQMNHIFPQLDFHRYKHRLRKFICDNIQFLYKKDNKIVVFSPQTRVFKHFINKKLQFRIQTFNIQTATTATL